MDLFNYLAVLENKIWVPAKDGEMDKTSIYTNYSEGYWVWFYYACLFILGNDGLPLTTSETIVAFISVFIGAITTGILVS